MHERGVSHIVTNKAFRRRAEMSVMACLTAVPTLTFVAKDERMAVVVLWVMKLTIATRVKRILVQFHTLHLRQLICRRLSVLIVTVITLLTAPFLEEKARGS